MTTESYDSWFRKKVQEALDDKRPGIAHAEIKAKFAARRDALHRQSKR